MKNVVVLGSTGSIGESTLRVAHALPDQFRLVGLAVHQNTDRLLEQVRAFGVEHVAVTDRAAAERCAAQLPAGVTLYAGPEGLVALAALAQAAVSLSTPKDSEMSG